MNAQRLYLKDAPKELERKRFLNAVSDWKFTDTDKNGKQLERNGQPIGIIEGYIATWDLDRGDGWMQDQFERGAFKKSIREFKKSGRWVRMLFQHHELIGGFDPDSLKEDDVGLWGRGEINLNVQRGAEAYALAKQKILVDFSIGYRINKSTRDEQADIRTITQAELWEGSLVDEPMNPKANVTDIKNNQENEEGNDVRTIEKSEVEDMTKRDLERALTEGVKFSSVGATIISSFFKAKAPEESDEEKEAKAKEKQEALDEVQLKELLGLIKSAY